MRWGVGLGEGVCVCVCVCVRACARTCVCVSMCWGVGWGVNASVCDLPEGILTGEVGMVGRLMGGPSPASVGRLFKGDDGATPGFSAGC